MYRILLKKFLYDYWDNLLFSGVLNILFIFLVGSFLKLITYANNMFILLFICIAYLFLASIWLCIVAEATYEWIFYRSFELSSTTECIKKYFWASLFFLCFLILFLVNYFIVIPFYVKLSGSIINLVIAGFIFWIYIVFLFIFLYFLPVRSQLPNDKIFLSIKKSSLIFIDNIGFSLFLFIFSIILIFISAIGLFIFIGPSGIFLFYQVALKLRLLKYDYLKTNPENSKKIPWQSLHFEENSTLGSRSLKDFIFPWK